MGVYWMFRLELRNEVKAGPGEILSPRSFAVVMILFLIRVIAMIRGVQCLFHRLVLRMTIDVEGLGLEQENMLRSARRGLEDGPLVVKGLKMLIMLKNKKGQREVMIFR